MEKCRKCGEEKLEFRFSYFTNSVTCLECSVEQHTKYRESLVWKRGWTSKRFTEVPTICHAFHRTSKSICGRLLLHDERWTRVEDSDEEPCQICQKMINKRTLTNNNQGVKNEYK